MQSNSLSGKNAIVTGGTRGIGLAITRAFLEAGATVTICSRKEENVKDALQQLEEHRDAVHGRATHVGDADHLQALLDDATSRFGPVNVLVNNAGTNPYYGPILESDDAAWEKTLQVNLQAPYRLSKLVARQMVLAESGSIVNIASVAGLTAIPMQGIYSVTKAGLIMLTKVMARELGSQQVRVNCICPGVIKTKLSAAMWADPETEQQVAGMKALGRVGGPEEIVGAAVYFASDASSFTTGAVLTVDGGMVL